MKKIIFVILIICGIVASVPWIWLESTYGITNIPHYNLTMWIFMLLYAIFVMLVLAGVLLVASGVNEEEPEPRRDRKARRRKPTPKKPRKPKKTEDPQTEEEAPAELQDEVVEYPDEWDEEDFE